MVSPLRLASHPRGATRRKARHGHPPESESPLAALDIFKTPAYVINLKERPDRWQLFMSQGPAPKALEIHKFQACNGKKLDPLKDKRISTYTRLNIMRNDRRTHREVASLGAVGASISHATLWKKIVDSGVPYAVVFEDDARFDLNQLQKINELAPLLPSEAQVWLFGLYKPNLIHDPYPNSDWSRVYHYTAAHAYVITRAAAQKFLEQAYPVEMHLDHYMSVMSVLYNVPMVMHKDLQIGFGGLLKWNSKTTAVESNTSQHQKDGCSACHVPDHLSRFYKRVGPKTRAGRIVHGLVLNKPDRKVLNYRNTQKTRRGKVLLR